MTTGKATRMESIVVSPPGAWRIRLSRLGWPGGLACALVATGIWVWAQAPDDDLEITRLTEACDNLNATLQTARTANTEASGRLRDQTLGLDPNDARPESLRTDDMSTLLAAATRHGLDVASVRYQWLSPVTLPRPIGPAGSKATPPSGAALSHSGEAASFARERADIAMSGNYAAFRAWLEELLTSQPTLGLAAVHLRRKDSTTSTLGIDVSVDMGYRSRPIAAAREASTDRAMDSSAELKR
jgi:hypothetical protein